jgi:Cu/Ag efflux protein CusF
MKKVFSIVLSILLVISIAGMAVAKEKVKVKQITGEVAAVDAAAKTLVVKGKKTEVTVTADEKALVDIKAGDKVVVKYTEQDGKNVAKSVKKAADKAEKKGTEKKAEPAKPAKPAKK